MYILQHQNYLCTNLFGMVIKPSNESCYITKWKIIPRTIKCRILWCILKNANWNNRKWSLGMLSIGFHCLMLVLDNCWAMKMWLDTWYNTKSELIVRATWPTWPINTDRPIRTTLIQTIYITLLTVYRCFVLANWSCCYTLIIAFRLVIVGGLHQLNYKYSAGWNLDDRMTRQTQLLFLWKCDVESVRLVKLLVVWVRPNADVAFEIFIIKICPSNDS